MSGVTLRNTLNGHKKSINCLDTSIIDNNLKTQRLENAINEYYSKNFFIKNLEGSQLVKKYVVNDLRINLPFIAVDKKIKILARAGILIPQDPDLFCCIYSSENNYFITGTTQGRIKIWDLNNYPTVVEFFIPGKSVTCFAITSDETALVVGLNQAIAIINLEGKNIIRCESNLWKVEMIRISKDNLFFFATDYDGNIRKLWIDGLQTETKAKAHVFSVFGSIKCAEIIDNDSKLMTGGTDGFIKIWDKDINRINVIDAHQGGVEYIAVANNRNKIASLGKDNKIKLWKLDTYQIIWEISINSKMMIAIEFSKLDNQIAVVNEKKFKIYDAGNSRQIIELKKKQELFNYLQMFPSIVCFSQFLKK